MLRLTQVSQAQMLTGGLDFFHLETPVSFVPTADEATQTNQYFEQARVWESVVEMIRTRANLVIVGQLEEGGFSFAVEIRDALDAATMEAALREMGEVDFGGTTVDLSGVTLQKLEGFKLAIPAEEEPETP